MNCDSFQRRLLIDPNDQDAEFRDHARACPGCAKDLEAAASFERRLRSALSAELGTTGYAESSRSTRRYWGPIVLWLFLPLLIGVAWIGLRGVSSTGSGAGTDWSGRVIGHILDEPHHMLARGQVPAERLQMLFASLGGNLQGDLGRVRFAGRCAIGRRDGIHLVLEGEQGPVTALFIPGAPLGSARAIGADGLQGSLVPAAFGNLAVVGGRGEPVDAMVQRLLSHLDWAG